MRAGLAPVLEAACDAMTSLAIYPLVLEADADGAYIVATMRESVLRRRSRGPYSQDDPPSEAMAMVDWVAMRWSVEPERPEFTIEGGDRWPRLVVSLPASRVTVRFVVPEDAPPVPQPPPNNVGPVGDIKLALRFVARSLALAAGTLGGEPPVTVRLTHPDNPRYEVDRARLPAEYQDLVMPVTPTVELDRSRCDSTQREAHDVAVRSAAYSDQPIDPVDGTGFTAFFGSVRLRDAG